MRIYLKQAVEIDMDSETKTRIEDCLSRRECITVGCEEALVSRGLCDGCLSKFKTVRQSKPVGRNRDAWERKAIEAGMVLASGEQRRLSPSSNPFAQVS